MKPKISIIVPVYNVEKYLRECLKSICKQTYSDFEVLLIDDGSTDNSYEICKEFSDKDSRYKVMQQKNMGPARAVLNGFSKSKGDFICFIDSDDVIEKNYLRSMVEAQKKFKVQLVLSQMCRYRDNKKVMVKLNIRDGYFSNDDYQKEILSKILNNGRFQSRLLPVNRWGKLISRELITDNLKYVVEYSTYGEDLDLVLPIFLDIKSIYILPNKKNDRYLYRIRATSLINAYDPNRWNSVKQGYQKLYQAFKDKKVLSNLNLVEQLKLDYFSAIVQCCTNEIKNPHGTYREFEKLIYEIRKSSLEWKPNIKNIDFGFEKNNILSITYYGNKISLYNCFIILKFGYLMKVKLGRKKD